MTPILPEMAEHLAKFGEMRTSPELIAQLRQISILQLKDGRTHFAAYWTRHLSIAA